MGKKQTLNYFLLTKEEQSMPDSWITENIYG